MRRKNLFGCLAGRKFLEYMLDCEAGTAYARLTHHHSRIAFNQCTHRSYFVFTATALVADLPKYLPPTELS